VSRKSPIRGPVGQHPVAGETAERHPASHRSEIQQDLVGARRDHMALEGVRGVPGHEGGQREELPGVVPAPILGTEIPPMLLLGQYGSCQTRSTGIFSFSSANGRAMRSWVAGA
jgi:hypothetical protein